KRARDLQLRVPCFLQVNVSGEASKHGLAPEEAREFVRGLRQYPSIDLIGLMTMAPLGTESEQARPVFRALRALRDELNREALTDRPLTELSMGMSGDFEAAVEEGATWVRLGTVLVGK